MSQVVFVVQFELWSEYSPNVLPKTSNWSRADGTKFSSVCLVDRFCRNIAEGCLTHQGPFDAPEVN